MADDDVTIGITVEDSTAMAKLAELQAELAKTQSAGMGGGAGSMRAGISVGQVFPAELEKMASAGGRYKQVLDEVRQSTAGVTGATNELSEETQKAGINIEGMMTRMVTRFAVFEAVRVGMKMLTDEFKEVVGFEAGRVAFENMTIGAKDATEAEKILDQVTKETGIDHEKLYSAVIGLEDAGEGPRQAAEEVKNLGKFAAATHGDIDKMSKALSDIRLDRATIPEMFDLAHRMGDAKDEMVGLVGEYASLTREIQRADHARAEELATMREQVDEQEKLIDAEERAADIASRADEKQIADYERLSEVRERFLEKMLEAEGKPPGHADPVLARAMKPGGLPVTPGGRQMAADIKLGLQEIQEEEGLTQAGMKHFIDTGLIGYRDVMAAAKRLHAAEKEARTEAAAKTKQDAEDRKRGLQEEVSELSKEDTAAKRADKVQLDQKRLELADKFTKAIDDQVAAEKVYAGWAATAEGKMALAAAHAKEIREQSEQALVATKAIALAWEGISKSGGLPPIGGVIMTGQSREAALAGGAPGGKVSVKEDNSDESVRCLRGILDHLSGQGTP